MFKSLNRIFIVCFLSLFMAYGTFVIAQAATLAQEDQENQVIEVLEVAAPAYLPNLVPEGESAEDILNILQIAGVLTDPLLSSASREVDNATGNNSNVASQLTCILIQYNNNPDFSSDPSFDPAPSCSDSSFVAGVLAGQNINSDLSNLEESLPSRSLFAVDEDEVEGEVGTSTSPSN